MGCGACPGMEVKENEETSSEHSSIKITDNAAKKITEMRDDETKGLRIGVMPGGCAGFSYTMEFDNHKEEDITIEDKGIKLFLDNDSLEMLKGTTIDYVETLQQSGFKLNNPNAKSTCGCGKSSAF